MTCYIQGAMPDCQARRPSSDTECPLMSDLRPTLHFFCGKIAAGKSTLAAKLAEQEGTVLIAEDAWLAALYAD